MPRLRKNELSFPHFSQQNAPNLIHPNINMTASAPPAQRQCVIHESKMNESITQAVPKSRSKKNFTVGYFQTTLPFPREVVLRSTDFLRRNNTEATNDDMTQSHSPKKKRTIRATDNVIESHPSPQSVVSSHRNTDKPASSVTSGMHQIVVSSAAQHDAGAPGQSMKMETSYDMNEVAMVKRNPLFLKGWRSIALTGLIVNSYSAIMQTASAISLPSLVHCDDSEPDTVSEVAANSNSCDSSSASSSTSDKDPNTHSGPCHACLPQSKAERIPFGPDFQSVIWAPRSRSDWEDCIDEMVAVCTAAAWHKHISLPYKIRRKSEFNAPISRNYIKDRIEIDDPLRGYQIRHKTGGWLQGFVMMTNFTTWTHYFKWDSEHKSNGIVHKESKGLNDDGKLAEELEGQVRSGDPLAEGVVWGTIAEISLVGALGCGEYLLQMALDDISRRGCYDYVVLEATETSRPFYEKFGFVRIGAVCKYGNEKDIKDANGEVQDVGYRHWSYAQTTEEGLDQIGAPSCMMARRIKKFSPFSICNDCGKQGTSSFVDQLGLYFVPDKPRIRPLGSQPRKRSMSCASASSAKSIKKPKTTHEPEEEHVSVTLSGRQSKAPNRLETKVTMNRGPAISLDFRTSKKIHKNILLRKQIIPTGFRCPKHEYYYNKVVTPKSNKNRYKTEYYFVINYDIETFSIRLIPLFVNGVFKGKREGRPKWKANVLPRLQVDQQSYLKSMDVISSISNEWKIVKAFAVTKCVSVQGESWDIEI
jgi:hypothetical protein